MTSASSTGSVRTSALDVALSGRLGVDALRRLLGQPVGSHGPLAEDGPVELLRTKYKPGRKLTGYYRWGAEEPRFAASTWCADGRTSVLVSPDDPAMPQLRGLCDPARLAQVLATSTGGPVCHHPRQLSVRTLRYRPGQRHVLHVTGGRLEPAGVYLKLDRDTSGARAVPVAIDLAQHLLVAVPVGYVDSARVAVWRGAAGQPLSRLLRDGSTDGPGLVHRVGEGLRALHDSPVRVDRSHSVPAEVAATQRAGEHIAALLPSEGDLFGSVVRRVAESLERCPVEPVTLGHGDVKCDNLLAGDGGQVRFLDLDRVVMAEPALDLAKFLADLRWWCPDARFPALRAALRAGYGPCDPVRWTRADLLAGLLGAKLVARRCGIHDPAWGPTVRERLAGVAGALDTVGAVR